MVFVTLAFSRPPRGSWIYVESVTNVEARISGHWKTVENALWLGSLGGGETKQEVLLMPGNAERCRIHLRYAGASVPWRFGGWLSRFGVKLPPKYWRWTGWPRPDGRSPRRNCRIEVPLRPSAKRLEPARERITGRLHPNDARGLLSTAKFSFRPRSEMQFWTQVNGELARSSSP
jgi:hypothetical protein